MLTDDNGHSKQFLQDQTMRADHPAQMFGSSDTRRSVDQHPESYERTRLVEHEFDAGRELEREAAADTKPQPEKKVDQIDVEMKETEPGFGGGKVEAGTSHGTREQYRGDQQRENDTVLKKDVMRTPAVLDATTHVLPQASRPSNRAQSVSLSKSLPRSHRTPIVRRAPKANSQAQQGSRRAEPQRLHGRVRTRGTGMPQHAPPNTNNNEEEDDCIEVIPRQLAGYIRVTRADIDMGIRYNLAVVTVNEQKYVQLRPDHLVLARNCPALCDGPDTTIRVMEAAQWDSNRRGNRPAVLFVMLPLGEWQYTQATKRVTTPPIEFKPEIRDGSIVLNANDRPLKSSIIMPQRCSTEIEGWEMEALCRYDTTLCYQDFIDRMLPARVTGKVLPSAGALDRRRRRDRMRMRIITWPTPSILKYTDQVVINQAGGFGQVHNSTRLLEDLTQEQMHLQYAVTYGACLGRPSLRGLGTGAKLNKFRESLALVRRAFGDRSFEVDFVLHNIGANMQSMGMLWTRDMWMTVTN